MSKCQSLMQNTYLTVEMLKRERYKCQEVQILTKFGLARTYAN